MKAHCLVIALVLGACNHGGSGNGIDSGAAGDAAGGDAADRDGGGGDAASIDAAIELPASCPCPLESYCDLGSNTCHLGCVADGDCGAQRYCDVSARTCRDGCRADNVCGAGEICTDHQCVVGCRMDIDCGTGHICRSNQCMDACVETPCTRPPSAECVGSTLRTFATPATCALGICSYSFTDAACPGGCSQRACTQGWFSLSNAGAPVARGSHSAVWTGTEMIIWGGEGSSGTLLADGGRFNPISGAWAALPTAGAPMARMDHTAVWTGTEMIVWGGFTRTPGQMNVLADGGRFNPATGLWTPLPATGAPAPRRGHAAVWTGTEMIVWGGADISSNPLNTGGRFNPTTGAWVATPTSVGFVSARQGHTAVWRGGEMFIWGGRDSSGTALSSGGRYIPQSSFPWDNLPMAPFMRSNHTAVFAGGLMIVWGGDGTSPNSDILYDTTLREWGTLTLPNPPPGRRNHTAVWTGTEMIVWGGSTTGGVLNTGDRLVP